RASSGLDGSSTILPGGSRTSVAMDAMRASWSGSSPPSSSTASSAITFSTMFRSAIEVSRQRGGGRAGHFDAVLSGAIPRAGDFGNQSLELQLSGGGDGAGGDPRLAGLQNLAQRGFRGWRLHVEQIARMDVEPVGRIEQGKQEVLGLAIDRAVQILVRRRHAIRFAGLDGEVRVVDFIGGIAQAEQAEQP